MKRINPDRLLKPFFVVRKSHQHIYTKNDMMIFIETDVGEILETPNLVPPGNLLHNELENGHRNSGFTR